MIFVPDVIFKKAVDIYLKYVADDIVANELTPEKSFLKKVAPDIMLGSYSFFDQGCEVLNKAIDDPRLLEVDYMYNMRTDRFPNMFIHTGSVTHGVNAMGMGQGQLEDLYTQINDGGTEDDETDDIFSRENVYTRRMNGTLNLVIMSDNSNEVMFLWYIIQAGLISLLPHLAMSGFENIKMSGQDLVILDEVVPKNTFKRVIQLNFEYVTGSVDLTKTTVIKDIEVILSKIYDK